MKTFALWFGCALFVAGFLAGFTASPYDPWTAQAGPYTVAAIGYIIVVLTMMTK